MGASESTIAKLIKKKVNEENINEVFHLEGNETIQHKHGDTFLHMAVRQSDLESVEKLLLYKKINLYKENENKKIPLELALDTAKKDRKIVNEGTKSSRIYKYALQRYMNQKKIVKKLIFYMENRHGIKPDDYLNRIIEAFKNYSGAKFENVKKNPDVHFGEYKIGIEYALYEYIIKMEEKSNTERNGLHNSLKF